MAQVKMELRHGKSHTKLYKVYTAMKQRCNDRNDRSYHNYGGRGISVCNEWSSSFKNFYNDMIEEYGENVDIDRVDNNGNYCKENCRWIRRSVNLSNKRVFRDLRRGVARSPVTDGKFTSSIKIEKKCYHLGTFSSIEEASSAYNVIHKEWYGADAPK